MWRRFLLSFFVFITFALSISCESFRGIAHPGENYTTRYNLPAEPIVPYTNPGGLEIEDQVRIGACNLVRTEEGIRCL